MGSSEVVTTVGSSEVVTTVSLGEEDNIKTLNQDKVNTTGTLPWVTTVDSSEVVTTVALGEEDNTNALNHDAVTTTETFLRATTVSPFESVTTVTICEEDNTNTSDKDQVKTTGTVSKVTTVGTPEMVTTVTICEEDNTIAYNLDQGSSTGTVQTPRMSAVFLGTYSTDEVLNQTPRGRSHSIKRSLNVSPENEIHRPRKISVEERMISPRLRSPSVAKSSSRRNTWGSNSKRAPRKRGQALAVAADQKLITQLFKPCGNDGRVDVENDEGKTQGSSDSYHK